MLTDSDFLERDEQSVISTPGCCIWCFYRLRGLTAYVLNCSSLPPVETADDANEKGDANTIKSSMNWMEMCISTYISLIGTLHFQSSNIGCRPSASGRRWSDRRYAHRKRPCSTDQPTARARESRFQLFLWHPCDCGALLYGGEASNK